MKLLVHNVDVWAATIPDKPGGLANVLAALRDAKSDLQLIIARRAPEKPGTGVVFVTPLERDREIRAAAQVGFNITRSLHCIRIIGADEPGIAVKVTQMLAEGGINLRGFSASVIGAYFVAYVAVDTAQAAKRAMEALRAPETRREVATGV